MVQKRNGPLKHEQTTPKFNKTNKKRECGKATP